MVSFDVEILKYLPRMLSRNFSQAQVTASASFSICAYRHSVSVIDLDANATGHHSPLFNCVNTAPSPCEEASAVTLTLAVGL